MILKRASESPCAEVHAISGIVFDPKFQMSYVMTGNFGLQREEMLPFFPKCTIIGSRDSKKVRVAGEGLDHEEQYCRSD